MPWPSGPVVVSTPGVWPTSGCARRLAVQLAEFLQFGERQGVAGQVEQRVDEHRAVAVRQDETVAVGPLRVGRVVFQVAIPQRHRDFRHAHRGARVSRVGCLYTVNRQNADGVRQRSLRNHESSLLKRERKRNGPPAVAYCAMSERPCKRFVALQKYFILSKCYRVVSRHRRSRARSGARRRRCRRCRWIRSPSRRSRALPGGCCPWRRPVRRVRASPCRCSGRRRR